MRARKKEIPRTGYQGPRSFDSRNCDRVVRGAQAHLGLFSAFRIGVYGYRPKRAAQEAVLRVDKAIMEWKTHTLILICELTSTMFSIICCEKVARRVQDLW
jgi:hypothetical protein